MNSIWTDTVKLPEFPKLSGKVKTDVLIVGGGMAGILLAHMLDDCGVDYILVEAKRICSGITKDTTAKITAQHGLIYDKLLHDFGLEKASLYLQANERALEKYRKMAETIDCDFQVRDSYVYSLDNYGKLQKELMALEKIGYKAEYATNLELPFLTEGAVKFKNQGQFHPLKLVKEIAKNLNIYENTKVTELVKGVAKTNNGEIHAQNIVIATHYPIDNKHGWYFMKMYQSRSYVLAVEKAPRINGMYVDEADSGLSFRSYQDLLILGGSSHRTGKATQGWRDLERFVRKHYPNGKVVGKWATQDCMTLDKVPYIGAYGKRAEGMYVATGFNKWGMTSSMVSAMVLKDMVMGKYNPYRELFLPHRSIIRPQLFINIGESAINLLLTKTKRCPHMGCALKYNQAERSWDCPCHGSRFTEEGEVIDNPATDDIFNV